MRIAFVVERFPSLSETFILSQIAWLLDAGHDVRIFASRRSHDALVHPDVERLDLVRRTRFARAFRGGHHRRQLQLGTFLLGQVARGRVPAGQLLASFERSGAKALPVWTYPRGDSSFDAIVAHFGPNGVHAMEMREAGVIQGPLTTFFHGYDMNPALISKRRGYPRLFEAGDRFLPVSDYFRARLLEWGAPPERTMVHHMGVDPGRFEFRRRELGREPLRLISVARLVPKKGLAFGIRAAASLGKRVQYRIVGEGPERASLESLVRELGAGEVVQILGWRTQDDVSQLLAQSHVLIAPSRTTADGEEEGIPVALMEALATGLPVVSTWHSGIPELVQDGINGYLVPESHADLLAERLAGFLENPGLIPVMGEAGRETVQRNFNNDTLHPRLEELLHAPA